MNEDNKIIEILNNIINSIPESELPLEDRSIIQAIENKNKSISFRAYENILIKITFQSSLKIAELRKAKEIDLEVLKEKFYSVKDDENSLYYKFNIINIDDIQKISDEIKYAYKYLNSIEPIVSFGCCSRYIECSDSKKCVNTIRELRKGCIYKKNLESGKIFYGKNATIDSDNIDIKKYTIIDTENPNGKGDSICSISLVAITDGNITLEKEYLVNPEAEFEQRNINIHHITQDMVKDKPTFLELWRQIGEYFKNSVIIAHNAQSADLNKICKALNNYNEEIPEIYFIDTLKLAKETFPNLEKYNLEYLSEYFGFDLKEHHNSLCDAKACYQLLKEISKVRKITDNDVRKYVFNNNTQKTRN
ncbi:MAG: exonuclease domain-containing protein [Clostridia bacterium]